MTGTVLVVIVCECGCGSEASDLDARGRPRRFIHGHNHRGKSNVWLIRDEVNPTTYRERARKAVKKAGRPLECQLVSIGGCADRIEVHHADEDPSNNDLENLWVLCTSHHRLVHNGRVDLSAPSMPPFYVDGSGKRRYAHSGYAAPQ